MKVDTIMTKDVAFCKGNTRLDEVAKLMATYNCSAIPVFEDEKGRRVVGILTARDIVNRTLAVGKNPAGLTAASCMTSDVFVARKDSEIEDCLQTMEQHHVRRLPVIDDKRACCGIVTLTNIAEFLPAPTVGEVLKEITEPNRRHNGGPFGRTKEASTKPQGAAKLDRPTTKMPYLSINVLPDDVKRQLPRSAQEAYLEAYNSALSEMETTSKGPETPEAAQKSANKVAWASVKQRYQKQGEEWIPKNPKSRQA
jgi:CBS domain-containing protein/cation transport regulator ChaB